MCLKFGYDSSNLFITGFFEIFDCVASQDLSTFFINYSEFFVSFTNFEPDISRNSLILLIFIDFYRYFQSFVNNV